MKKIVLTFLLFTLSVTAYSVKVTREISNSTIGNKQSAIVTIKISKHDVDGIAKLNEQIPDGYRAFVTKKGGGKVLLGDKGELKIVWLTLPVKNEVKVEYRLIHLGKVNGTSIIKGNFTFIQGDMKQEESINPTSISVGSGVDIVEEQQAEPSITTYIYKVQLGVFSAKKDIDIFNGLPDVHYSKINGFYKYFSGKFDNEQDAKNLIPQAKSKGFKGAFLVREKK